MLIHTLFVACLTFCMCLPPAPIKHQELYGSMSVEWKDISYYVTVGHGQNTRRKQILHSLSGKAEPGHLVAIMGPTGR